MAIRNFWIKGQIDGQATPIAGGPRRKDGGFSLQVYMRDEGSARHVLAIEGRADGEGNLALTVSNPDHQMLARIVTRR